MGLLKKVDKSKPLRIVNRGGTGGTVSALRPVQQSKLPPCTQNCPSGNDIRGWLTVIAEREKMGMSLEQACDRAFEIETDTNPFPAIMGRVCPHPCESGCNRKEKDDAVAANSVERFIGDWAINRGLPLKKVDEGGPFKEKIVVIGAGPSGLSCAYQMARRGYAVTVLEELPKPGGMLRYGIPVYRLPREIIDAEIARIEALGVQIHCNTTVGRDTTLEALKKEYAAIYVSIGAHRGRQLKIRGEEGPGVYTGAEFLRRENMGDPLPIGNKIVVIGGGDTAVDAARVCVRRGQGKSEVTILYRRTREEMPAIDLEVNEALEEGIQIEFLAAPAEIVRDASGKVTKLVVQRMSLGEPDASGRRRPVPVEGKLDEMPVDTVVSAVSQQPDVQVLGAFQEKGRVEIDPWGHTGEIPIWSGGDDVSLGLATAAVGQGRIAAVSMHAALRGKEPELESRGTEIGSDRIKFDFYEALQRSERDVLNASERLSHPTGEVDRGITEAQALLEASRCLSCGSCFGCERCWMYCTPSCFKKITEAPQPGAYYTVNLNTCDGCKKCADECPCGFLDMV